MMFISLFRSQINYNVLEYGPLFLANGLYSLLALVFFQSSILKVHLTPSQYFHHLGGEHQNLLFRLFRQ